MTPALAIIGILLGLWALAELKTSRPDGTPIRVHPYRRLLAFITPGRAQSSVAFDTYVDADPLLAYLEGAHEAFGAHLTHAVVAACFTALAEVPRMNRFVVGRRLYQRTASASRPGSASSAATRRPTRTASTPCSTRCRGRS